VGANFPRRYRSAGDHEPVQRGDRGEARLWRLGTALAVSFTVAVVGLAGLAWLAWVLLGLGGYRHYGAPALKDTIGVLRLEPALTRPIRWDLIVSQYDQMIKYATAIRTGTASTEAILRRFTKANAIHPPTRPSPRSAARSAPFCGPLPA